MFCERMAKLGDGWMPGGLPIERARPRLEKLHDYLREEGRDPAHFGIDPFISLHRLDNPDGHTLEQWQALGATHASILTMHGGNTRVEEHLAQLERFIKQVK